MWLHVLLTMPCLAILVNADTPAEKCFDAAATKYITCNPVPVRPAVCNCTDNHPCYIKMEITKLNGMYYINRTTDLTSQGPTIIAKKYGIIVIDVSNNMDEDTSIHFHGMRQYNVPWIDGVGNVTQYPIPANGSRFRYILRANPQGTHWYHSHMRYQRDSGLFGALIVHEEQSDLQTKLGLGPFEDQPERKTLAVRDRFVRKPGHGPAGKLFCLPDGSNLPKQFEEISFAVNGNGLSGNLLGSNAAHALHRIYFVVPGKNYRFRIIGATLATIFIMSIDHHKMHVMATDGYPVKPFETDFLIIHVAERYDFILKAKKHVQPGSKYAIRFQSLAVNCVDITEVAGESFAFLLYTNKSKQAVPRTRKNLILEPERCRNKSQPCTVLNCPFRFMPSDYSKPGQHMKCFNILSLQLLYPTPHPQIPSSVNESENEFFFNYHAVRRGLDVINGVKFLLPEDPILESSIIKNITNECPYENIKCDKPGELSCTHIVYLKHFGNATRFVYSSIIPGHQRGLNITHPLHMHGHTYFIAKIGYPEYNENGTIEAPNMDLKMPSCGHAKWRNGTPEDIIVNSTTVRKDTVIVPAGGYVVIQFLQRNPGWWFMHCHIDYHLNDGMAIAIGENHKRASTPPDQLLNETDEFCFTVKTFLAKEQFNTSVSYENITQAPPKPTKPGNMAKPTPVKPVRSVPELMLERYSVDDEGIVRDPLLYYGDEDVVVEEEKKPDN